MSVKIIQSIWYSVFNSFHSRKELILYLSLFSASCSHPSYCTFCNIFPSRVSFGVVWNESVIRKNSSFPFSSLKSMENIYLMSFSIRNRKDFNTRRFQVCLVLLTLLWCSSKQAWDASCNSNSSIKPFRNHSWPYPRCSNKSPFMLPPAPWLW